jgi:glucosamine--fructose-6-phosphate aminotransferase (isomerizing)
MCGIIGYVGDKNPARIIINGLKRLEYRGYDSSGIAMVSDSLTVIKKKGKISSLEEIINYNDFNNHNTGIGHTRWATHGEPSDINSHPHTSCDGGIAIVHNGIIENYVSIKKHLVEKGHRFVSQTDTEVVAHLIEHYYKNSLLDATIEALSIIEGTYGLAIVSRWEPERIIVARKGSPLVIGIGENETIVASDCSAIIEHTRQVVYMEDEEVVEVTAGGINTYDVHRKLIDKKVHNIDWDIKGIEKGGFPHFMLKEIHEQVESIRNAYRGRILFDIGNARLDGMNLTAEDIGSVDRIIFIACGTSWHAGLIGEYLIEEFAKIPAEVEYASEFRYRKPVLKKGDLVIVISQSGETADTLAALREAKEKGIRVLAVTNVVGSTIARESCGGVYIHAGPEIGVASTKAFTSQVTVLILITLLLSRKTDMTCEEGKALIAELEKVPELVNLILKKSDIIKDIAEKYKDSRNFLYLGRGVQFPVALEGALKLKEISYIHAEGYPAAEMKHGPIALIDENMPVVIIALRDEVYPKILSNIQEVKARGGKIIAIASEGDNEIGQYAEHVIYVPVVSKIVSPLLTVIPLQLLSYYMAVMRGCDVDQPRNLAKSVTVE